MNKSDNSSPNSKKFSTDIFYNPEKLDTYFEELTDNLQNIKTNLKESYEDFNDRQETFPELNRKPIPTNLEKLTPPPTYEKVNIPEKSAIKKHEKKTPQPKIQSIPTYTPPQSKEPSVKPISISTLVKKGELKAPKKVIQTKASNKTQKGKLLNVNNAIKKKKEKEKVTPPPKKDKTKHLNSTPKKLTTHSDLDKKLKERESNIQDLLNKHKGGTSI